MKRYWTYDQILFALALWLCAPTFLHAQKQGLPLQKRNVIDLRYQQYENALPRFPKEYPFLHRFYLTACGGVDVNWERSSESGRIITAGVFKSGLGFKFTPVHALEADYAGSGGSHGMNLNYVLNLSGFATRQASLNRFEAYGIAGIGYRKETNHQVGMNTGMRFMYNPRRLIGLYMEPGLSVCRTIGVERGYNTRPYVQAGVMFRFGNPQRGIADILPPFALKTNLLFDLASALNVEIEFPICERFSVAADWVFPWWTLDNGRPDSKRTRLQLLNGNFEGRYWFGNREKKRLLNGWFTGIYAGGGLYDVEWKGKGVQGEFFIAAGVSGGFAHLISRRLSLEYALGVGMMRTDYQTYEVHFCEDDTWYPIRQKRGRYTWVGPTKVKVSLVWLINDHRKKGRRS